MASSYEDKLIAQAAQIAQQGQSHVTAKSVRLHDAAVTAGRVALGLLLGLAIWEVCALIFNASGSSLGFPDPPTAFARLVEYLTTAQTLYGHTVYEHLLASFKRLLIAFSLAATLGVTAGSILGSVGVVYQIGMVPVSIYQMIPGLAWLPVAILVFGLGDASAVFIIFAVSCTAITVGVSSGIRMVPPVLIDAARMSGASWPTIFLRVMIPHAAASIINALRLGMSSGWRVLIAAEMVVGTGLGLGYSIQLTRDLLDYVGSFACITIICLTGLLLDRVLLASIERWMRGKLGLEEH